MHTPLETITALLKRRGFIFPGSDIYGGLAGTFDYGPLGVLLKEHIKRLWWHMCVTSREDMYGIDAAILMNGRVWEASGHVSGFADPLVDDLKTGKRYRADHLLEEAGISVSGLTVSEMSARIREKNVKSPEGNPLGEVRSFNMLFPVRMGASEDSSAISYLRGETAQGIFVNFKNVVDAFHPKLPFGIAQIGKAFRNEIAPRDFIFRTREFEQMEVEYFVRPENWESAFEEWHGTMHAFARALGIKKEHLHDLEVGEEDRAHYSKRTIDFEFDYPFGKKELWGLAYRTDFDLKAHTEMSGVDLSYQDEETKTRFIPHVIEPSLGVDRTVLATLASAYAEDELGGEKRVVLRLPPIIAPYTVAVFPLLKNKPELVQKAREVFLSLKKEDMSAIFDDNGNIGKRYRRQDEIGTPYCVTIDFETIEQGNGVTVRDRDSGVQTRVPLSALPSYIKEQINNA